jgi:long-chain acyl-CoA synthetase
MVPAYDIPGAVRFTDALAQGAARASRPRRSARRHRGAAVHGGTTGVSKGAVLLHRNLVANILQSEAWYQPALKKIPAGEQVVTDLRAADLSHLRLQHEHDAVDAHGRLQHPDRQPARPAGVFKELQGEKFHSFPASTRCSTRWRTTPSSARRLERPGDLGGRRHGGAERHRQAVAREDRLPDRRGLRPVGDLAVGHLQPGRQHAYSGNIGLPMPNTELKLLDDDGNEVPLGTPGRDRDQGPAGDGRLLAAPRRDRRR